MKQAFYFGCADNNGHFLHDTAGRSTLRPEKFGLPWSTGLLDGGLLKNSGEPDRVTGRVHSTCGGRITMGSEYWWAFYWWDRSGDSRPGSNSGFYVSGFEIGGDSVPVNQLAAFSFAMAEWPHIILRQQRALVLVV